ncbi:hypothetical protein AURDEDRAFT_178098 [Auricularia subglabra TFB-10046 SS5]|uniref:Uncharacterized protein n=1 Tax=Auricularia subglabra (strain TFB-10046 / SS5) TaxID=717982 RepID=J0WLY3_AURST|nr:hypothetical protein AURDEDRAFT_178098 [Auricularia subglabra TFB-10046 SS5]
MHVPRCLRNSLLAAIGVLAGLSASRSYALSVRSARQRPRSAELLLFNRLFPSQALPIAHHAERHNGLRNRHASRESCLSQTADLWKLLLPTGCHGSVHIAAPSTHACTRNELPILEIGARTHRAACASIPPMPCHPADRMLRVRLRVSSSVLRFRRTHPIGCRPRRHVEVATALGAGGKRCRSARRRPRSLRGMSKCARLSALAIKAGADERRIESGFKREIVEVVIQRPTAAASEQLGLNDLSVGQSSLAPLGP